MDNLENSLLQTVITQRDELDRKLKDMTKEYNRKTYIATNVIALIIQIGTPELLTKLKEIEDEADKMCKENLGNIMVAPLTRVRGIK